MDGIFLDLGIQSVLERGQTDELETQFPCTECVSESELGNDVCNKSV